MERAAGTNILTAATPFYRQPLVQSFHVVPLVLANTYQLGLLD